ncbi:MAG: phosphatase PAP2 family protein [Mariprofundales bacterium]|nr:phosphatase PAP2 family protein [Mariprofundales bacterium]
MSKRHTLLTLALLVGLTIPVLIWNLELFTFINGHNNAPLDRLFGLISGLGDGLIAVVVILAVAMFRAREGCAALAAFILSGLFAQLIKRLFDLPRPPAVFEHVHLLGAALRSHSFPSGHATTDGMMAAATLLIWRGEERSIAWMVASFFVLAAIGRIYGGVHFPRDVWVGWWIGIATMAACWYWSARWPVAKWQQLPWWPSILALLLAICAGVLGLGYRVQPSTAQPLALLVPVIALYLLAKRWKRAP